MNPAADAKTLLFQSLAGLAQGPGYRQFKRALGRVEVIQQDKFKVAVERASRTEFGRQLGIPSGMGYQEFARKVPVHSYADLEPWIERQRQAPRDPVLCPEGVPRFEPTSGSTSRRKWIPYTRKLMSEFDAAASAWIFDLILGHPSILNGPHYWSLSWIPTELRAQLATVNDLEVFPPWKRNVMSRIMAVPSEVSSLPTLEGSLLTTLAHLAACRDLSFISVWSPTFLLQLLHGLSEHRKRLQHVLSDGVLGVRSRATARLLEHWNGAVEPPFLQKLWPRLRVISAWDSSTSAVFAAELRRLFPRATLQGKGLWATEGVVTIPFHGRYPLAATSHFYEFRDLESGEILPSWKLRDGLEVQPILTTGSGFLRYPLMDRLRVSGFLRQCPCFEFRGRLGGGTDLVGEKLDPQLAADILAHLTAQGFGHCVSLIAHVPEPDSFRKPCYVVLAVGEPETAPALAAGAEAVLKDSHHYALARELGQLGPAEAQVCGNFEAARAFYEQHCGPGSRVAGATKIEALALWNRS